MNHDEIKERNMETLKDLKKKLYPFVDKHGATKELVIKYDELNEVPNPSPLFDTLRIYSTNKTLLNEYLEKKLGTDNFNVKDHLFIRESRVLSFTENQIMQSFYPIRQFIEKLKHDVANIANYDYIAALDKCSILTEKSIRVESRNNLEVYVDSSGYDVYTHDKTFWELMKGRRGAGLGFNSVMNLLPDPGPLQEYRLFKNTKYFLTNDEDIIPSEPNILYLVDERNLGFFYIDLEQCFFRLSFKDGVLRITYYAYFYEDIKSPMAVSKIIWTPEK